MENDNVKTYKGILLNWNTFICEDGTKLEVLPYRYIMDSIEITFPVECFINVSLGSFVSLISISLCHDEGGLR
jgi:hypothetical protein